MKSIKMLFVLFFLLTFKSINSQSSQSQSKKYLRFLPQNQNTLQVNEEIKILFGTFNAGGLITSETNLEFDPKKWNLNEVTAQYKVLVLGFQEIIPLSLRNVLNISQAKIKKLLEDLTNKITILLGGKFKVLPSCQLVGIYQLIFIHNSIDEKNYQVNEIATKKFGFKELLGNKGTCLTSLTLFNKSISISNCHLHHNKKKKRISKLKKILNYKFKNGKQFKNHDYSFIIGDLNFRLDLTPFDEMTIYSVLEEQSISDESLKQILLKDQLNKLYKEDPFLKNSKYMEGEITFKPTYKFNTSGLTNTYKRTRIPAWCDRILYRSENSNLKLESYSTFDFRISDHKPVFATFNMKVQSNKNLKFIE